MGVSTVAILTYRTPFVPTVNHLFVLTSHVTQLNGTLTAVESSKPML
jgi:hypothetical protein